MRTGQQRVDLQMQGGPVLNSLYEPRRKAVHSSGATEHRANDCAAMAVFAADVGVGNDSRFEIVGVLPGEIERRQEGVGDVTRSTEPLADHDVVRVA